MVPGYFDMMVFSTLFPWSHFSVMFNLGLFATRLLKCVCVFFLRRVDGPNGISLHSFLYALFVNGVIPKQCCTFLILWILKNVILFRMGMFTYRSHFDNRPLTMFIIKYNKIYMLKILSTYVIMVYVGKKSCQKFH